MFKGLSDFVTAVRILLTEEKARRWYFQRLMGALALGLFLLFLFIASSAALLWYLYQSQGMWLPAGQLREWVGATAVVLWLILIYFISGPMSLLIMTVYLTQWGEWENLRAVVPIELPEFEESFAVGHLFISLYRALGLVFLILLSSLLGLIPFLVFVPFIVSAFTLGKDWIWTADELYIHQIPKQTKLGYALGLGLFPALLASIPVLGVATLPALQFASLLRYKKLEKINE